MSKFAKLVGFDAEAKQTTVKTELVAGLVTFLAMAYILTVNPGIIGYGSGHGELWSSLFIATALGAIVGTLLMAFFAKMPLAQASGMGLNSLLAGLISSASVSSYGGQFTVGQAFMFVLISGVLFLLLSVIKVKGKTFREMIFDGMPIPVRSAISVGIGLFIAYIGFQGAKIISASGATISDLIFFNLYDANVAAAAVCFVGLFLIAILDKLNVKGAVILGILGATLVGIPLGVTDLNMLKGTGDVSWKFWDNFANFFVDENSVFGSFTDVFKDGLMPAGVSIFSVIMIIVTMCMIDMFDTMGSVIGCCVGNKILSDENGKPRNYGKIMLSDSIATCAGAMIGASTVTTFVEAGAGVSAGGRTGLTALAVAGFFFLAMFAMPLFATIPSPATSAALIYVGVLMMKNNIKTVDFGDPIAATSAFLTIVIMVLGYSITDGIGIGMIAFVIMSAIAFLVEYIKYAITKENKPEWKISAVAVIITALFILYFLMPTKI